MSFENIFGPDSLSIEKARILGLLERDGITEETRVAVIKWTEQMEVRSRISLKEMIRFNVDRAELYEAIGAIDEMFECLGEAHYQVIQEKDEGNETGNWDEFLEKIQSYIAKMEEKYPA